MPTQTAPVDGGRHAYVIKTSHPLRARVLKVAAQYGISYNAALNILLDEALEARGIPKDN